MHTVYTKFHSMTIGFPFPFVSKQSKNLTL